MFAQHSTKDTWDWLIYIVAKETIKMCARFKITSVQQNKSLNRVA